jgi:YjbE family integral membrane protein
VPFEIGHGIIASYLEVTMINLVLSGDNVIVISMAAATLPKEMRRKAIFIGVAAAALIRIVFAVVAVQLLEITGIMLVGGLLLLWVCWNMLQELRSESQEADHPEQTSDAGASSHAAAAGKALSTAIIQIIVADISMSLDNVLAVAGAASGDMGALVFGLTLSVVLMACASTLIASLLAKYRWIGWMGLAIIVYVAGRMLFSGAEQLLTL